MRRGTDFDLAKFAMRARKYEKVQAKKLVKSNKSKLFFREITFLAVLNFILVQKLIFGQFGNCKKWNLAKKHFVKLIHLTSRIFLIRTFLNFLAPCGTQNPGSRSAQG